MLKKVARALIPTLVIGNQAIAKVKSHLIHLSHLSYTRLNRFYLKRSGFTLIELLIVIVIISLFSSVVLFNITPDNNKALKNEFLRLAQLIQLAQDEAIMQGKQYGLSLTTNSYTFSTLDNDNQWRILINDRQFKHHQLKPNLSMTLEIEDELLIDLLATSASNVASPDEQDEQIKPVIIILSSGELTAFKLSFYHKDNQDNFFHLTGYENGELVQGYPNEE